jgi:proteasome lid subunit RPN8/RPN11
MPLITDDEMGNMKTCMNKQCKRFKLITITQFRRCTQCNSKLKDAWTKLSTEEFERASVVYDMVDIGKGGGMTEETKGAIIPITTIGTPKSVRVLSWSNFKGTWEDWKRYKTDMWNGKDDAWDESAWAINTTPANSNWGWEVITSDPAITFSGSPSSPSSHNRGGSDTFTCDSGEVKGCPISAKTKPQLKIPFDMYCQWVWLALRFSTEWIAYLKGTQADNGDWTLTEMYFPKQRANAAHVDAEDNEILEGTIGSVHSHVGMSAFFSTEDEKHFNHNVEIVVNRKGELATAIRRPLECSRFYRAEANVLFTSNDGHLAAEEALNSKLTAQTTGHGYKGGGYR